MSTIELVAPLVAVDVNGEQIVIKPFTFGQLPTVTQRIAAIAANLDMTNISLPVLISEGGEDILALIALACGKPRAWLDSVEMDKGLELLAAVVQLNQETFVKKLMPALQAMAQGLAK